MIYLIIDWFKEGVSAYTMGIAVQLLEKQLIYKK